MIEYRRGVASKRKNGLWHWHPDCESYPTQSFSIRKDRPTDDDLCARCHGLAQAVRTRSAA
jgi:hypothetical protein